MRKFLIPYEDYNTTWFHPSPLSFRHKASVKNWLDTRCKNKYKLGTVVYKKKTYMCVLFDDDDDYVRFVLEWD